MQVLGGASQASSEQGQAGEQAGQWSVGLGVSQIIALPFPGVTCDSPSALPLRSYVSGGGVVIRSFSPGTGKGTNGIQIRTGTMRVLGIL